MYAAVWALTTWGDPEKDGCILDFVPDILYLCMFVCPICSVTRGLRVVGSPKSCIDRFFGALGRVIKLATSNRNFELKIWTVIY